MDWLYTMYGQITSEELQQKQEMMKEPYSPVDPIKNLFDQIENEQEYADTVKSPFTDRQLIDMGIANITQAGDYTHAYLE